MSKLSADAGRDDQASLIGQAIDRYRIRRQIGRGGMGVVYEAVHETMGQRAAVKVLSGDTGADQLNRFLAEARAASMVPHPGLVKVYNCGQLEGGAPYILMEFLDGESLQVRMRRVTAEGERVPVSEALSIARQLAEALDAVHRRGITHRDLKPGNVVLLADGGAEPALTVKVVDFGIAKIAVTADEAGAAGPLTTEGKFLGTAIYASPEQCRMEGGVGTPSDVYSLGVILYELLAGRPPFLAGSGATLAMHILQPPPPLQSAAPGLPEELYELVRQMLDKAPERRPTMAQVAAHLARPLQGGRPLPVSRRRQVAWVALPLLLTAGGAGWMHRRATPRASGAAAATAPRSQPAAAGADAGTVLRLREPVGTMGRGKATIRVENMPLRWTPASRAARLVRAYSLREEHVILSVDADGTQHLKARLIDVQPILDEVQPQERKEAAVSSKRLEDLKLVVERTSQGSVNGSQLEISDVASPLDPKAARILVGPLFGAGRGPVFPATPVRPGARWSLQSEVIIPGGTPYRWTIDYQWEPGPEPLAKVSFVGNAAGETEDSRLSGKVEGWLRFDPAAGALKAMHVSSVSSRQPYRDAKVPGAILRVLADWESEPVGATERERKADQLLDQARVLARQDPDRARALLREVMNQYKDPASIAHVTAYRLLSGIAENAAADAAR